MALPRIAHGCIPVMLRYLGVIYRAGTSFLRRVRLDVVGILPQLVRFGGRQRVLLGLGRRPEGQRAVRRLEEDLVLPDGIACL